MQRATSGVVASGTATLEAAALGLALLSRLQNFMANLGHGQAVGEIRLYRLG